MNERMKDIVGELFKDSPEATEEEQNTIEILQKVASVALENMLSRLKSLGLDSVHLASTTAMAIHLTLLQRIARKSPEASAFYARTSAASLLKYADAMILLIEATQKEETASNAN